MHGWKICHLYWRVMNHATYTMQTWRGYPSTCFLIEPWRIKENIAMAENIRKTYSLCFYVLIVMEVTNKCQLWLGNNPKLLCFKNVKKFPTKYHANGKSWMTAEIFCSVLHSLDEQMVVQNRQIILFVENCAAHPKDTSFLRSGTVSGKLYKYAPTTWLRNHSH